MAETQRVRIQAAADGRTSAVASRVARPAVGRRESDAAPLRRLMAVRALQPRLAIGAADDAFEREAERTADLVMTPEAEARPDRAAASDAGVASSLMRVTRRALADSKAPRKDDDEDRKVVQKLGAGQGPASLTVDVESSIERMTAGGAGQPLPEALRSQFERRFGCDFGDVRIHTGREAARAAASISARAFTVGNHIFFGAGEYQPEGSRGQRLVAHELTHVVQQSRTSRKRERRDDEVTRPADEPRSSLADLGVQTLSAARVQRRAILSWEVAGTVFYKTRSGEVIELPDDMTPEQVARLEDEALAAEKRLGKLPKPKPVPDEHKPAPKPKKTAPPKAHARRRRGVGKALPKLAETAAALVKTVGGGKVAQYLAARGAPVFARGVAKLSRLKHNEQTHDDGGEKLKKTEHAVVIPKSEDQSKSNASQVGTVGDRKVPEVDENKGKQRLVESLEANAPRTIEAVDNFRRDKKAQHTSAAVLEVVQGDKNAVIGTFGDLRLTPAPVAAVHDHAELPPIEKEPPTPQMNLGRGAVAPLKEEHTDLGSFVKEADGKLKEEGVTQEQLDMVDSGDLAEANKEKKGLAQRAATEPLVAQKFAREETEKVDKDLAHDEKHERKVLAGRRKAALESTAHKQKHTKTALEKKREDVAAEINGRYQKIQDAVTKKLADLETRSMKRFDDGNAAAAKAFEDDVHRELEIYKDDRYSGWFGWARKAKDWLLGMDELPGVKAIFERNRTAFVKKIDTLVEEIAAENKRVIEECKQDLADARKKIQEYVDGLEPGLKDIGKKAAGEMQSRLDDLDKSIGTKEEELQAKLKDKQTAAIRAIDQKIEKMKEAMSGALAKLGRLLLYAAKKFFTWALEKFGFSLSTIENIINKGIAVLKAIFTHPIQFVKNLVGAAKSGFMSFAKNFLTHLKDAVFEWLTGALEGITLPDTWNLKGILSVVFQLLGLTWSHIKARLVLLIPAPVVDGLETTFGLVKTLISDGPIAAWEQLKEIGEDVRKGFVDAVTSWIKWKVVEEAVKTVVAMFVPGAGIIRAIIGIYDTIVFFIQRAKDIVQMIGNFLGSIAEIAAGNIGAAAQALEDGLARGLKLVITFLAKLLRLDGITAKIRVAIDTVRGKVTAVIDKVATWVVGMAKKAGKITVGAAKAAAGKLLEWWKEKRSFSVDGNTHTIYFEGGPENPQLFARASPGRPIRKYLQDLPKPAKETNEYKKALAFVADLEERRPKGGDTEVFGAKKIKAYNDLSPLLEKLWGDQARPPSIVTFGAMQPGVGGTSMEASVLTRKHERGTRPSDTWKLWQTLNPLVGGAPYYILGHLLNENLGGKGRMFNLTPITTKANADHHAKVETHVKTWVTAGKVVRYTVEADYGGGLKKKSPTQRALEAQSKLSAPKKKLLAALEAERQLAKRLTFEAYVLKSQNDKWVKDPAFADKKGEVPNEGSAGV